jgi:hypothetical protein
MGYTTNFSGSINLSRKLTFPEARMLLSITDDSSKAEGKHPNGYLQWVPNVELDSIVWDGNEKFYDYIEWMEWIICFMETLGIDTNGIIHWGGEDPYDIGVITIEDGKLTVVRANKSMQSGKPLTIKYLEKMALDFLRVNPNGESNGI